VGSFSSRPILVVDDDPAARAVATNCLEQAGFTTREAENGENVRNLVSGTSAQLVLLEVALPGPSGFEICRELREEFGEQLPIILVSADRTDELDRSAALLLGADDYLVKPLDADRLLAPVRRLLARSGAEAKPKLTEREHEILSLLAAGHARSDIADKLVISRKTVAKHIEHILAKLGVHSEAQAIASAFRDQLVEDGHPDGRRLPTGDGARVRD
jgi:two-component system, NarL family, nitrate/nitrite response regulator NarL